MSDNIPPSKDISLSKTKIKQAMHNLQALGKRLTTLSRNERNRLNIPTHLEEAIIDYLAIKSNSAQRRQLQFIGRIMRELPEDNVQIITNYFLTIDGKNQSYNAYLQRLERTRESLISSDNRALTEYLSFHPEIDATYLRTLIRNCQKEQQNNKPLKSYREILRFLKTVEPFDY